MLIIQFAVVGLTYTCSGATKRFIEEGTMEFIEILSNQDSQWLRVRAENLSTCLKIPSNLAFCHHGGLRSTSQYLEISGL